MKNTNPIRKLAAAVFNGIISIDDLFSRGRDHIGINQAIKVKDSDYILVWATYSSDGKLSDEEKAFLQKMESYPRVEVIVVMNTDHRSLYLQESDFRTIFRPNRGRDLAGFRTALELIGKVENTSTVVLLNSSCVWSAEKLIDLLKTKIDKNSINVMTDSYQGKYHVQSYFLTVPYQHLEPTKRIFSKRIRNWRFKRTAVICGEKKLYSYWLEDRIPINILFPATFLQERTGRDKRNTNYTKDCSYDLLQLEAPFLKKSSTDFHHLIGHL